MECQTIRRCRRPGHPRVLRLAGLVYLLVHVTSTMAAAADYVIFRARGQDFQVQNSLITAVYDRWRAEKATIEQTWEAEVNKAASTIEECILGICTTFTISARETSVTLPAELPRFSVTQGSTPNTLRFSASFAVNDWSTRICAPSGGALECDVVDERLHFDTTISISGTVSLDRDGAQRYFLRITDISGAAQSTGLLGWILVDPQITASIQQKLRQDANRNGVADLQEPVYLDAYLPNEGVVYPIYTYLSAGGKFPFSLTTENGTPVVTVLFGDPIVGNWFASKTHHPRLLYTAAERPAILARMTADFQGWYDRIKSQADQTPTFPVSDFKIPTPCSAVVSEQDWAAREVPNARIALAAALVYDLERDKQYLYRALEVLFKFADSICDPLFTYQWGQNSLYAAEILSDLSQAYDLLLGSGFPTNLSQTDFLQNKIGLPNLLWSSYSWSNQLESYRRVLYWINRKFQSMRDVMNLETHAWDLVGSPNISIRAAAALGMSALLFNQEPDAYENISLATSVIWKRLGIASGVPFDNATGFTKASEGEGYAEGPHYLNYAAELYLPFLVAYDKFLAGESQPQTFTYNDWAQRYPLQVPNLLKHPRVQGLHEWALKLALPNGKSPAIKDSNPGEAFYSGLLANATATPDPVLRNILAWHFAENNYPVGARLIDIFVSFDETILQNSQAPSARYASPTQIMQEAGNAVLRSGWDSRAIYLHALGDRTWVADGIVGGTRIPYHQQEDNGSFIIHAYGDDLAIDSGYGNFPVRDLVAKAANHNLVLIDGHGPSESTEASISDPLDTLMVDHVQVTTTYQGVDDKRHVLFLDNRYFAVVDDISAPSWHRYDWKLHGNGTFTSRLGGGLWTAPGGQQLQLHVTTTNPQGLDGIDVDPNAPHFTGFTTNPNDVARHTAIAARTDSAVNVRYVATLFPSDGTLAPPTTTDFSDGYDFAAIKVQMTDRTDYLIVKNPDRGNSRYTVSGSYTGGYALVTDARILWLRLTATDKRIVGYFVNDASYLSYNNFAYVTSPVTATSFVAGDIDGDGDVDSVDLAMITRSLNTAVHDPNDPRDLDHDGKITVLDTRKLTLLCTRPKCAAL